MQVKKNSRFFLFMFFMNLFFLSRVLKTLTYVNIIIIILFVMTIECRGVLLVEVVIGFKFDDPLSSLSTLRVLLLQLTGLA